MSLSGDTSPRQEPETKFESSSEMAQWPSLNPRSRASQEQRENLFAKAMLPEEP
jgi:hypothetical protein